MPRFRVVASAALIVLALAGERLYQYRRRIERRCG